jgi:hypothetical protein
MEKENEKFLKDSDSDESDSCEEDNEIINIVDLNNNSRRIPSQDKAELIKIKQENQKIKNDLVENSSDEKSNVEEDSSLDDSFEKKEKPRDLSHHCSYFEISDTQTECKHKLLAEKKTISRTSCLNCEYKNELLDSLDHLAFLSPKEKTPKKKFYEELKFDSPTKLESLNDSLIITETDNESENENEKTKSINQTQETYLNDSSTIINETISSELIETQILTQNETINDTFNDEKSFGGISNENSNQSFVSYKRRKRFKSSESQDTSYLPSGSMSETTFVLSDSDYDEDNSRFIEHALEAEERYESKRKKALSSNNESQMLSHIEQSLLVNSSYDYIGKELGGDEAWFCPFIEPPLASELNEACRVNNEPIVKYYKTKEKFKLVNYFVLMQEFQVTFILFIFKFRN